MSAVSDKGSYEELKTYATMMWKGGETLMLKAKPTTKDVMMAKTLCRALVMILEEVEADMKSRGMP